MMHGRALESRTALRRTAPSSPGGDSGTSAPAVSASKTLEENTETSAAHRQQEDENSPAAVLLKTLFTPSFFRDVWEQKPLVIHHTELQSNPFLGHKWISEEDMICMCYRAAVAGTLKIFRQGVAYPPPNISPPSPRGCRSRARSQAGSPPTPRKSSPLSEGKTKDSCGTERRQQAELDEDTSARTSTSSLSAKSITDAPVAPPLSLKEGPLGGLNDHTETRDMPEPSSADLLACVGPYLDGCSLVLNQADRTHRGLHELCRTLAERLFAHVFAVAYLTPPSSYAVGIHTDDQDVFLLQLWGRKRWKVYAPPQELPLTEETLGKKEPFKKDPGPPVLELTLQEGDILYIPRGFLHEASTTNQNSLHITITVPTAEYAYVNALSRCVRSLVLEHKLGSATEKYCRAAILPKTASGSAQSSDASDRAAKATKEIVSHLKLETVEDILQKHLDEINALQLSQFRRLHAFPADPIMAHSSLIRLSPGIRCACEEGSAEASFYRDGQSLRMRICSSASAAIHQLATAPALVEVSELRCLDDFERLCVLLVLHKKGLIEVVEERSRPASRY